MITNRFGIPEDLAAMISEDRKKADPARFSVTKLLLPTRIAVLAETEEPIEDVSDSYLAFLGSCVHFWLEYHRRGFGEIKLETRLGEDTVVGVVDRFDPDTGTITDYKTKRCSDTSYEDAAKQIKCYAWMLRRMGHIASKGRVVVFRRDWSKLRNRNQPPVEEIEFPILPDDIEWAEGFVKERIAAIKAGRKSLPECSPEEKWYTGDEWACYKKEGDERAARVFRTEEEANAFGFVVRKREGKDLRCESFCPYARVCRLKRQQKTKQTI